MARAQTNSGVQQVGVAPVARPVNTFNPVRLDPAAIQGLVDLAPLSASVASVVGQLNQDYHIKGYQDGSSAIQNFAAAHPELVQQELGGTDEDRKAVRKKLRQAVAEGQIPESANPILYELWDQVTMRQRVYDLEAAVRQEMDAMTQVMVNGQRVEPKPYTQVRAEKIEELGITETPGYSSVFGQRAFANGLAIIDSRIQQEVSAAVAENTRRATRDGVRQGAQALFSDLANKPIWGPDEYAAIGEYDKAHVDGVANVKGLMVEAILSQASSMDPEAAAQLLSNAGDIAFGTTKLSEDASEFSNGVTYQEALEDMTSRVEREADRKLYRKTQEEDEQWKADAVAADKLISSRAYELGQQGVPINQIRQTLEQEILSQFGDNGPRLLDDANSYLDEVEARGNRSDPDLVRTINDQILAGNPYAARELLLAAGDKLNPKDKSALHNDVAGAVQATENLEADPAWRRTNRRLEAQFAVPAEITDEQGRARAILFEDEKHQLEQDYLERVRANPNDTEGNRLWLETETEKAVQRDRERQANQQQQARTAQEGLTEKFRRYDSSASADIAQYAKQGLISSHERKTLEAELHRSQNELQQEINSQESLRAIAEAQAIVDAPGTDFTKIVERTGELIDPMTGGRKVTPTAEKLKRELADWYYQELTSRFAEIHTTAEPSQFPALRAQARREVGEELGRVMGEPEGGTGFDFEPPTAEELADKEIKDRQEKLKHAEELEDRKAKQVEEETGPQLEAEKAAEIGKAFSTQGARIAGVPDIVDKTYREALKSSTAERAFNLGGAKTNPAGALWSRLEHHKTVSVDNALSLLKQPDLTPTAQGQIAADALSLYGIPWQQVVAGEVVLSRATPDMTFTNKPRWRWNRYLEADEFEQYGNTYADKESSLKALAQAKATLEEWKVKYPSSAKDLERDIAVAEGMIARQSVPLAGATINPFVTRLFQDEADLRAAKRDSATWSKILSSKNFTSQIEPGSPEEKQFLDAQVAAIRRNNGQ